MTRRVLKSVAALGLIATLSPLTPTFACTRVLWNNGGPAILAGRTMDWPESTEPILTVLPRGLKHDGGKLGKDSLR